MEISKSQPVLKCTLEEFCEEQLGNRAGQPTLIHLDVVFRGKAETEPRFMICCGDHNVFLNHVQLLCRFTALNTWEQEAFIMGVREAMLTERVDHMEITIPWATHGKKRLRITKEDDINFTLELV
jgi:hypothetical protein